MGVVEQLPDAEYGGSVYNISSDVVFTIVPAREPAQQAPQPQTSPITLADVGFDPSFAGSTPGIDALKSAAALAGPAAGGITTAQQSNIAGESFSTQGVGSSITPLKPYF
jgi:hypothetical protein